MVESSSISADRLAKLSLNPTTAPSSVKKRPPPSFCSSLQEPTPKRQQLLPLSDSPTNSPDFFPDLPKKQSPTLKKLKRIRDQMRQLTHFWDQILQEKEEIHNGTDNRGDSDDSTKEEGEGESKEAMRVEKTGDGSLLIRFNCPCGRTFQVIFSGNDCYYKIL